MYLSICWYITLIDLCILKNVCIPGINPTWSWCMTLLLCCWNLFARILLRIFVSMFIDDVGLYFRFLWYLCLVLVLGSYKTWTFPKSISVFLNLHGTFLGASLQREQGNPHGRTRGHLDRQSLGTFTRQEFCNLGWLHWISSWGYSANERYFSFIRPHPH